MAVDINPGYTLDPATGKFSYTAPASTVAPATSTAAVAPVAPSAPAKPAQPAPNDQLTPQQRDQFNQQLEQMKQQLLGLQQKAAQQPQLPSAQDQQKVHDAMIASGTDFNNPSAAATSFTDASSSTAPPAADPLSSLTDPNVGLSKILDQINTQLTALTTTPKTSLVDTFNTLMANNGIPGLDLQIVNLENVMNGTANDVRNEITKGGGFASDSQVQAIVGQRNQILQTQLQGLVNLKQSKMDYIDKVVQLTGQDATTASQNFDRATGLVQIEAQLQQTASQNEFNRTYKYLEFNRQTMNDAKSRLQLAATTGALGNYSDAQLQQYAQDAGVSMDDLTAMRQASKDKTDATATKNDVAIQRADLAMQTALLNIQQKQNQLSAAQENAQAIMNGTLAPGQLGYRDKTLAYAEIHKIDPKFSIKNAELEYEAAQKFMRTINDNKFVNFQFRSGTVVHTIDNMRQLSRELKRSGLSPLNKLQIYAAAKGVGPQADLAAKYIAQVGLLQEDMANVFMGSGSPTDKALELAQKVINSDYSDSQLEGALSTLYDNVNFRSTTLDSLHALSPSGATDSATSTMSIEDIQLKYGVTL